MSEVVFILGAGASAHTGAPVMSAFFNTVCDLYEDGKISVEDKEAFSLIRDAKRDLERILVKVDLDLHNLETLFSLIEMGRLIGVFPGSIPIEILHKAIQRVIVRTIELKTNCYFVPCDDDAYCLLLRELKSLWGQRNIWRSSIITFNYDVAIDLAVERNVGAIDYCLHEKPDNSPCGYKLLKLHGSFNWAKYKENNQSGVIPVSVNRFVNEYFQQREERKMITTADLPIKVADRLNNTFQIDVGSKINRLRANFYSGYEVDLLDDSPLIVPPTWSKTEYHTILKSVWAQAAKEISEAKYIIIIGYSLPPSDLFFQYLLALGMLDIHRIKAFWVIDPAEATIKRYREFIGDPIKAAFRESPQAFNHFAVKQIHQFFESNGLIES